MADWSLFPLTSVKSPEADTWFYISLTISYLPIQIQGFMQMRCESGELIGMNVCHRKATLLKSFQSIIFSVDLYVVISGAAELPKMFQLPEFIYAI